MEYGYIRVSTREQNEQRLPDSWKSPTVPFCGAIFFSKERFFYLNCVRVQLFWHCLYDMHIICADIC